jgi:hypothetical protein
VAESENLGRVDAWLAETGHRGGDLRAEIRIFVERAEPRLIPGRSPGQTAVIGTFDDDELVELRELVKKAESEVRGDGKSSDQPHDSLSRRR